MKLFLLNLLLALLWTAVSGPFTPGNLLTGFVFGYLILLLARPVFGPQAYYAQFWRFLAFLVFYVRELVGSSVRVARDVLTPTLDVTPGVIGYRLEVRTDAAITILANLISLTPGTLSLDVSDDRSTLYVHSMYDGDDPETVRAGLRRIEVRVRDLMEPELMRMAHEPVAAEPSARSSRPA